MGNPRATTYFRYGGTYSAPVCGRGKHLTVLHTTTAVVSAVLIAYERSTLCWCGLTLL